MLHFFPITRAEFSPKYLEDDFVFEMPEAHWYGALRNQIELPLVPDQHTVELLLNRKLIGTTWSIEDL